MEIGTLTLNKLRNDEHYKFQTDFKDLVDGHTALALGIEPLYATYLKLYDNENEALDVVRKSSLTDDLAKADTLRETTYKGLTGAIKSACNHFKPEEKAAANRLKIIVKNYGNVTTKPYDEETTSIMKFVEELEGTRAADVSALGLTEWVTELKAENIAFDKLKKSRYTESAEKTDLTMKEVRVEVDLSYRAIVKRINALIEATGASVYTSFVKELNERIENYNKLISLRRGRNGSDEDKETDPDDTKE